MGRKRLVRNKLLIDADILVYKAAIRCEHEICWDDERDIWTLHADLEEAQAEVEKEMDYLLRTLAGAVAYLAFSARRTFRHEINPEYKANRRGKRKPVIFHPLRAWAKTRWPSQEWPLLEADDVLGILAKSHKLKGPKIVVSDDHDLRTVPCALYQPRKPELGVQKITYAKARWTHLHQTLTGDSGDNYSGLPGVGPVKATAILKKGTWAEVVEAYVSRGLTEDDALLQARMAKILTPSLFNQHTQEVILWNPKRHR